MNYYKNFDLKQMPQNELKVIDLFCGGGIGAVGIKCAGFDIIYSIDNNQSAVDTYNKNIGEHCHNIDIRKLNIDNLPDCDILMGSPTCKSFSSAGNNKGFEDEKYGDLSFYYLEVLRRKKPKAFVFENVKGMTNKSHKETFEKLLSLFEELGYNVKYKVINANAIGVAQLRERLIIVGIRKDINNEFKFPVDIPIENRPCIKDAIGDLPEPTMVMNSKKDIQYINPNKTDCNNHIGFGIRKDELEFVDKIPSGGNWRSLTEEDAKKFLGNAYFSGGGRTGFLRKVDVNKACYTITSVMNGKNNAQIIDNIDFYEHKTIENQNIYMEAGFSSRYLSRNRQKQWDEASFTIVSEVRQMPLYPEPANFDVRKITEYNVAPPRRFTVRECLRLQSVPDWFIIDDKIPLSKQYAIVGNGIPSLLTYKIFKTIEKVLKK